MAAAAWRRRRGGRAAAAAPLGRRGNGADRQTGHAASVGGGRQSPRRSAAPRARRSRRAAASRPPGRLSPSRRGWSVGWSAATPSGSGSPPPAGSARRLRRCWCRWPPPATPATVALSVAVGGFLAIFAGTKERKGAAPPSTTSSAALLRDGRMSAGGAGAQRASAGTRAYAAAAAGGRAGGRAAAAAATQHLPFEVDGLGAGALVDGHHLRREPGVVKLLAVAVDAQRAEYCAVGIPGCSSESSGWHRPAAVYPRRRVAVVPRDEEPRRLHVLDDSRVVPIVELGDDRRPAFRTTGFVDASSVPPSSAASLAARPPPPPARPSDSPSASSSGAVHRVAACRPGRSLPPPQ